MSLKNFAIVFTTFILVSCLFVNLPTEAVEPTATLLSVPSTSAQILTATSISTSTDTSVSTQSVTLETPNFNQDSGSIAKFPEQIDGVALHYYYDANSFFPSSWLREPINCTGRQFDLIEAPRVFANIAIFTFSYSSTFLKRNLTDIYILNDLECYGKSYGGTSGRSSIYLEVDTQDEGYTDQFLLGMLHSEFSSILIRSYQFPEQEWRQINQNGFAYSENALEVVEQDRIREPTKDLLEAGFLVRYATTSLENDFNMFAEWLFTREKELCELRTRYERINKKAHLAIEFYKSIGSEVIFTDCKQLASNSLDGFILAH